MANRITEMTAAATLTGDELLEVSQLSPTVTITATTISAAASDNSFNDSGSGFLTAGFAAGDRVKVEGFTTSANNLFFGVVGTATAGKLTIDSPEGDAIIDEAAGDTVTITKWTTRRATADDIAALASGSVGGTFMIPVLASAMVSRTTSGAPSGSTETTTNDIMVESKDFDQSTDEFVQFSIPMPESWNEGTVTAKFVWTAGATGNVVWGIQGVAISDDDVLDAAFGSAQTVTDGVTASGDLMISAATGAVTIGGTPAAGDLVIFQVYRDADNGSDTLAADAKLLAVRLYITTNAADDS